MRQSVRNKKKTSKQLERYFKGAANHHRISIIILLEANPGFTLGDIVEALHSNIKTMSEHTRRLVAAGLVNKQYRGRSVCHYLSPYGMRFFRFLKTFQHS